MVGTMKNKKHSLCLGTDNCWHRQANTDSAWLPIGAKRYGHKEATKAAIIQSLAIVRPLEEVPINRTD